jgi:2-amino-4-hydroxy-6-hydroxymethyldihydropteridine diphosphokinase/dihydropteroate synthase
MISYIGIGSNLGFNSKSREELISSAVSELLDLKSLEILKTSHIYENPALTSSESKEDWDKTFLNLALKIKTDAGLKPVALLNHLKTIELKLGRKSNLKWAARPIDLDILYIENLTVKLKKLEVPHKSLKSRNFVTAPLRDLNPSLKIKDETILEVNKKVRNPLPVWMAIANTTPDSFSDGNQLNDFENFKSTYEKWADSGVHIIDVGAESTKPGAEVISLEEEMQRLGPALSFHKKHKRDHFKNPLLSLDSRNYETIKWALDFGVDIINDVSGLADSRILDVLADSECDYVLMHSLTVPADPKATLNNQVSTTKELKVWLEKKLEEIDKKNISFDRIIFDPGIGFGKTARQSIELIRQIEGFSSYGLRVLAGHSRKSFMKNFADTQSSNRDFESAGMSLALASKGVDILRVHNPMVHMKTHLGFLYAN